MASLSKKDKTGVLIIAVCLFIIFGIAVITYIVNSNKVELDKNTLCPTKELPRGHTVILVDRTDPLAQNQTKWLSGLVKKIKVSLSVHEKLSIIPITKESGKFINPIFMLCSLRQGDNANSFYENPRRLRMKFDLHFGQPLDKVLDNLRKGEIYDESPIMETIQRLTEDKSFSSIAENKKIIIISDMLQNTRPINHYKKYSPDTFVESKYFNQIKPELDNTCVTIYYLASSDSKARKFQGERHKNFWKKFFKKSNAGCFSLIPISKLDLEESATLNQDIAKRKLNVDQLLSELDQLDDVGTFNKKGPSFNCIVAKTWDEKAICSNQELAQLDLALSKVYRAKLMKIKNLDQQRMFVNNQLDWLRLRHLCHIEENKTGCLKNKMSSRIEWIQDFNIPSLSKDKPNSPIKPPDADTLIKELEGVYGKTI